MSDTRNDAENGAALFKTLADPKRISRFMQVFLSGVLFVLGGILSVLC